MGQHCSKQWGSKVRFTTEFQWTVPNWRRAIASSSNSVLYGNLDQKYPVLHSKTFVIPGSRKGVNYSFIVYAVPKIVTRTKGNKKDVILFPSLEEMEIKPISRHVRSIAFIYVPTMGSHADYKW